MSSLQTVAKKVWTGGDFKKICDKNCDLTPSRLGLWQAGVSSLLRDCVKRCPFVLLV